jgi:hypothetical protein
MELVRSRYPKAKLVELESTCAAMRMDTILTAGLLHRMTAGCKHKNTLEINTSMQKHD